MTRRKQNRSKKVKDSIEDVTEVKRGTNSRKNNKRKPSPSEESPKRKCKSLEREMKNNNGTGDFDDDPKRSPPSVIRLTPPTKPPHDPKAYRVIKLSNGLKIVLISELFSEEGGTVPSAELTRGVNLPTYNSEPCFFQPQRQNDQNEASNHGDCSWCKSFSHGPSGANISPNEFIKLSSRGSQCHLRNNNKFDASPTSCSVAATVNVGYLNDPQEYPGLAHLTEHMVFMGNEAHPCEHLFMSFVRKNGGTFNACTLAEYTNYQFDVKVNALDETLDIFSNFFVQPLFSLDSLIREIENIDHEFRMKKQNDAFSRMELLHGTSKKNHPYRTFACGSKETLAKDCSQENYNRLRSFIVEFHQKYYVPQNMSLAIQAKLGLDDLEKLVVRHFSKLENFHSKKQKVDPDLLENPFDTINFKQQIFVEPVGAIDSLYITWALPTSAWTNYETKPLTYLSSIISSEVADGLVDYLKIQKWILDLKCGSHFDSCTKYGVLFAIRMYITDEGCLCQNEILQSVFTYLEKLRELKPSKVVYEDISSIKSSYLNNYGCNCSPGETVEKMSSALHLYPTDKLISGDKLLYKFDSNVIESVMNHLTADSANIMMFSHVGLDGQTRRFTKMEPHLKIRYDCQRPDHETMYTWMKIDSRLRNKFRNPLQKNRYKTTKFTLHHRGLSIPKVYIIRQNEHTRAVYLPLAIHFPFSCLRIALTSNQGPLTGNQIAMLQIWADMLRFELREAIGLARDAGIYSVIAAQDSFLAIEVYGYDEKALQLAREILNEISKKTVLKDETFFSVCKNFTLKMCHYSLLHPITLAWQLLRRMRSFGADTAIEAHSWLLQTSNREFNYFIQNFMSKMKLSLLVSGNSLQHDVELFATEFEQKFDCNLLKRCYNSIYSPRTVSLPTNNLIYRVESLNKNHSTFTIVNYYQFCPASTHLKALVESLVSIMEIPFFNEIRTQKTLGYAVSCAPCCDQGILGAVFFVVSDVEKHKIEDVSQEIDNFMANFNHKVISEMTQDDFAKLSHRFSGLKNLNLAIFKQMYSELFLPGGKLYSKAAVQVVGHKKKPVMERIVPTSSHAKDYLNPIELKTFMPKDDHDSAKVFYVQDIDELHKQLPLFPLSNSMN